MHQMINSDKYILQFHLEPGNLLIMNNYRTLHGRRSYNTSEEVGGFKGYILTMTLLKVNINSSLRK